MSEDEELPPHEDGPSTVRQRVLANLTGTDSSLTPPPSDTDDLNNVQPRLQSGGALSGENRPRSRSLQSRVPNEAEQGVSDMDTSSSHDQLTGGLKGSGDRIGLTVGVWNTLTSVLYHVRSGNRCRRRRSCHWRYVTYRQLPV